MKPTSPKISIIIATFNAGKTLKEALDSIVSQAITCELIVIDGGSTDNTVTILKDYDLFISYWHSAPDSGIYDALNEGISKSTGEWLYFLGADDTLMPGVLTHLAPQLELPNVVVYGNVTFDIGHTMISAFSLRLYLQNTVHHQSAFYHKSLFAHFRYDTQYKTIADYGLNLFVYIKHLPTKYLPLTVALCRAGGASADWKRTLRETNAIRAAYIHNSAKQLLLNILLILYYQWKQVHRLSTGRTV